MLSLPSSTRVFVYRGAMDMRCSFERLSAAVKHVLVQDPLSGHLFVFLNRQRTHVKILYFDRTGYAIWYKRLESGTFSAPEIDELAYHELVALLEGFELQKKCMKRRYFRTNNDARPSTL